MLKARNTIHLLAALILLLAAGNAIAMGRSENAPPRISVEQVRQMFGSPDLVIIDVRDPVSWSRSDLKIKGAFREDYNSVGAWADKYPKDKTIVLYCA